MVYKKILKSGFRFKKNQAKCFLLGYVSQWKLCACSLALNVTFPECGATLRPRTAFSAGPQPSDVFRHGLDCNNRC